jgi:hypothetical protein
LEWSLEKTLTPDTRDFVGERLLGLPAGGDELWDAIKVHMLHDLCSAIVALAGFPEKTLVALITGLNGLMAQPVTLQLPQHRSRDPIVEVLALAPHVQEADGITLPSE